MNILTLSWKNLKNKPLNLLLNLVLFALGAGLIILLLLLNHQLDDQLRRNQAGVNMVIGAKGSPLQLVLSSLYHIDSPTGNIPIAKAKPFMRPGHPLIKTAVPLALGDSYEGFRIVGTSPDMLALYHASIAQGQPWQHPFEVVLGSGVARSTGLKLGSRFHSSHGFVLDDNLVHEDADAFLVTGILKQTGSVIDQLLLTSPQSVWEVHGDHGTETAPHDSTAVTHHEGAEAEPEKPLYEYEDKEITSLLIQFKNINAQTLSLPRNINENTDLMAANPAFELDRLFSLVDSNKKTLRAIAVIILIVSALSIFISLYASLKERRYELALMRVMGASPDKLTGLVMLEGLLLAAMGCVFGFMLGHIGMELLSGYLEKTYRYPFTGWLFLPGPELQLLGGGLLIGLIAAFIPSLQARLTDISETLAEN